MMKWMVLGLLVF